MRAQRASFARVSDPSIDPESPYDSAAVAPDDGGDPKVVDRGGAGNPLGRFLRTVPEVVHRHLCRADVKISPGIMRVGAQWCYGRQRLMPDHTTSNGYGHPVCPKVLCDLRLSSRAGINSFL